MYVEFMKNFFLADSSELMGVRVKLLKFCSRERIASRRSNEFA